MPVSLGFKLLSLMGVKDALARKLAPLALVGLVALSLALAVLAFRLWLGGREKAAERRGAEQAVIAGQETTLKQIGDANEAGSKIRDDAGSARWRECLRDAAPGFASSCDRYRNDEPVSD